MKRFFFFLAGGFFLVFLQVIPANLFLPDMVTLNFSFAFVIFMALFYHSPGSWLLAFILGFLLETLSACPAGLLILINLSILTLIRATNRIMLFESLASQIVLVFFLNVLIDFLLLAVLKVAFSNPLIDVATRVLVNSTLVALISIPLFFLYNRGHQTQEI